MRLQDHQIRQGHETVTKNQILNSFFSFESNSEHGQSQAYHDMRGVSEIRRKRLS